MRVDVSRSGGLQATWLPLFCVVPLHRATIKLNMKFYNTAGSVVAEPRVSASRDHSYAGTKFASLEASVTEEGTKPYFWSDTGHSAEKSTPIVKPTELK